MVKLCDICRNLPVFINGVNVCEHCDITYTLTKDDTLLFSSDTLDEKSQYSAYLSIANSDPAIKRIDKECPTCGDLYGVAHLGTNEYTVMICSCK
jgi:hypothetical protein